MGRNLRALIVDDSASERAQLREILAEAGYKKVLEADGVQRALAVLSQSLENGSKVDFVLCDHNMPGADGMQLLKAIKGNPDFSNIVFLPVTAEGYMEVVMEYIGLGAASFVVKPVDAASVVQKIKGAFKIAPGQAAQ